MLLIVLHAQAMVLENTMYPLLPASDDDNNASLVLICQMGATLQQEIPP